MPIYEVKCTRCGDRDEYLGTEKYFISWLESHSCKRCGGELKKIPSASNFKVENGTSRGLQ